MSAWVLPPDADYRCPVCRARVEQGPQCRRCRADLTLLFGLEAQRARALAQARRHAAGGAWQSALAALDRADALRRGADVGRLRAAVHLLRGDYAAAWDCYAAAHRL